MVQFKKVDPSPAVLAARKALLATLKEHASNLSAQEVLALLAYMTGQAIAAQDATKMTPEMAIELIQINIEDGNLSMLENLMNSKGNA